MFPLYTVAKKAYVIFICIFDPFQEKRHLYTFENICREDTSLTLQDESIKIFLNTKGNTDDVDEEMKEFLSYVENTTDAFAQRAKYPLVKELHKKVNEVKQNKEMEVEYMTLLQRDRENMEQGEEKMAALTKLLLKEHRTKDLERALEDVDFRKKLFAEYSIYEI